MPIDFRPFLEPNGFRRFNLGVPTWPGWAKVCLFIPMIPGILLLAFAILVFGVSIAALFLLTVPVYLLLTRILGVGGMKTEVRSSDVRPGGSRRVEATVRDI